MSKTEATSSSDDHAIEAWFVGAERGYFVCTCGQFVDVAGYVNDSTEAALERHIGEAIGRSLDQ